MQTIKLNPVDRVEIVTLADNYVDLLASDNSEVITRGNPLTHDMVLRNSLLAEHGFSAIVKTMAKENTRTMIFDFGLTWDVAARNADTAGIDLTGIEAAALSHGHIDHYGGIEQVAKRIGKRALEFAVHPSVFRQNRYIVPFPGIKVQMPTLEKQRAEQLGFRVVETKDPYLLLDGDVLFLGEIDRQTSFEKGMPNAFYEQNGKEIWDPIEDDTGIALNIAGRGLVILSGCSHSGIINTVEHARKVTGIDKVHVVMGGFHLAGPAFQPITGDTIDSMKKIGPDYVVPTHCTGRKAILAFEAEMPGQFIVNMSGTKLTFHS